MSENSPNLALPYLLAAQAQKHVTVNEALRVLDGLVQLSVVQARALPPASPSAGARYLVAATASGLWAGWEDSIALFDDNAWRRLIPQEGWFLWNAGTQSFQYFDGAAWEALDLTDFASGDIEALGVATGADATNRLAVAAPASLFTHAGAGHQLKINKAGTGDTGTVLFQTGWSGRAEMGLAGEDDFSFKVSPDGSAWHEALRIRRETGEVVTPAGHVHAGSGAKIAEHLWTPGGDGVTSLLHWTVGARAQNPRTTPLVSVSGAVLTIDTADIRQNFGNWTGFMAGVVMVRIWNLTRSPIQSAWIVGSPSSTQLQVSNAADVAGWQPGDSIQIGEPASVTPNRVVAVDISPMMQQVFGTVFRQTGMVMRAQFNAATAGDQLQVTPSAAPGSFISTTTALGSSLATSNGTTMMPCTELSPVSNSNLLFYREVAASTIGTTTLVSLAVTV